MGDRRSAVLSIFAGLGLLMLAPLPGAAAEPFRIGVSEIDYLPHSALINGRYVGFARELFDLFAAEHDLTPEYRPYPRRRQVQALLEQEVDFIYPDDVFWEYTQKLGFSVIYSEPVTKYVNGVSVRPEALGRPIEEIRTLGVLSGTAPYPWRVRITSGETEIRENPRMTPLILQTLKGRVDGLFADAAVVQWRLASNLGQPDALVFDPSLPYLLGTYHLSTISGVPILTRFNTWLRANRERIDGMRTNRKLYHGVPDSVLAGG